ncbi:thymidine phosphorylase [Rhizobium sp. TRM95111]|uniref:thymidine phosphorylase n=1 Tax=Rhizobium alarense TaxID=2846851 RepID=UPI001F2DD1A1|nr:thymidine phosphorylase [Rhizobium alarense]MCF3642928.1 thymidine phosphorylase [Rhizobium alarense]
MEMIPQEIIRQKRDGERLSPEAVSDFIAGLTAGTVTEGQAAAFAMAVWFTGMAADETVALTRAMRDSGTVLDWSALDRPVADKHSTGGVGDNVSLMLAPIAAACGLAVPMISGRGLGHTGGTLDKLESIAGYTIAPSPDLFRRTVADVGCAIVGQTADLAPADRRLYAIRDVTATVDSVPLITASILSKKLAAGLQSLVLDVKVGNGAFMTDLAEARTLARSLVEVATDAGLPTTALVSDMNHPLADAAGNALEVKNCVAFLKGDKRGSRLETLVLELAAEMLVGAGMAADLDNARMQAADAVSSGHAAETFARMIAALGGPADLLDRPETRLRAAPVVLPVQAARDGFLGACATRDLGMAVIELGGGRLRPDQAIDHRVGFDRLRPPGSRIERGDEIGRVHAASREAAEHAAARLRKIFAIVEDPPPEGPLVVERITAGRGVPAAQGLQ